MHSARPPGRMQNSGSVTSNANRNDNNNARYTSATLVDNGYHYFPVRQEQQQQQPQPQEPQQYLEKQTRSEIQTRSRSKWTALSEMTVTQKVLNWASANSRDAFWSANDSKEQQSTPHDVQQPFLQQNSSSRIVQKKTRQLLPFVHQQQCESRVLKTPKTLRKHRSPINHNNNSNSNNANNNNACTLENNMQLLFPLDELQPMLLTPSTSPNEFREDKSPDANNFPVDQHYEHYYSYYYNRQSNFKQERKVRKLPDTTAMAAAKKNAEAEQLTSRHEVHVLKEQINNNNILVCDDEDVWQQLMHDTVADSKQLSSATPGGDFINVKNFNLSAANFNEPLDDALEMKQGRLHYDVEDSEPRIHKQQSMHAKSNRSIRQEGGGEALIMQRHAKLPQTPSVNRSKNPEPLIKKSPSPRPRVPLYNQSPRLSRAAHTYVGVRLQEWRRNHHAKSAAVNASDKIKKRYLNGFVQSNRAANTDCYIAGGSRTPSPVTVGRSFVLGRKENGDANDDVSSLDDEVDDDLDNVSDFGSDVSGSSSDEDGYRVYAYKLAHLAERSVTTQSGSRSVSSLLLSDSSDDTLKNPDSLLAPSLFPNVPPYLSFSSNTTKGPEVPPDLYRVLKWRISNVMPKVVRHILANSGMRLLKKTNDWMGVWGKHLKSPCFRTIRPYQKINHLPGSFKIGRKDSLWKSLQKHSIKHGKKEFGFMPKTYIIPNDLVALRKAWPRYASRNVKWIIKPPASARGAGIRVVSKWAQIPKRRPLIVQRYIERPLLINGSKFDLRLYVLVTSMNPLRVYLYHNGLARFASVKYSDRTDTLHDRCMHLTNYSINKLSSNYAKNEDVNACHGHKWTIKSLWNYLASRGVRTDYLWDALRNLVLRTLLVGESSINHMIRMNVESKYSVYELFGFDILLDADLIPWLLEVNISPSLHSELPLDAHVKAPLVQAVLNTALYNIPPKLSPERQREIATKMSYHAGGSICYDKRLYINYLSRAEKVKHNTFTRKTLEDRDEYLSSILEHLTPDDVRCLIVAEDELARSAPLERIFPTKDTHKYLKFCDTPRYYNRLLDAWESRYANNRQAGIGLLTAFCLNRYHLQVPQPPVKKYSYFEGDDRVFYSQPEEEIVAKSGLCQQISEMDIKIVIAAIVFVTIATTVLCAISFLVVKQFKRYT